MLRVPDIHYFNLPSCQYAGQDNINYNYNQQIVEKNITFNSASSSEISEASSSTSPPIATPEKKVRKKRARTHFSNHQLMSLESEFYKSSYLLRMRRIQLSQSLNLTEQQIKVWFQNRRMKFKKEQKNITANSVQGDFNASTFNNNIPPMNGPVFPQAYPGYIPDMSQRNHGIYQSYYPNQAPVMGRENFQQSAERPVPDNSTAQQEMPDWLGLLLADL